MSWYWENTSMKFAGILFKSGLAVAGAGVYLFFRRLLKKAKKTEQKIEKKIEKKIKSKKATATKKPTTKARQKKLRETGELIASR